MHHMRLEAPIANEEARLPSLTKRFAKAVVATFRGGPTQAMRERLAAFNSEDWSHSYSWLDESGLEFYLINRLRAHRMLGAVPLDARHSMEENFANNKVRTAKMFEEFVRINEALQNVQLSYCNVKGFALAPVSSPDPTLRRQLSLDFIMSTRDSRVCLEVLGELGYEPHTFHEQFCELHAQSYAFKAGVNIYQSFAQRTIRVYFVSADADGVDRAPYDMLMRRRPQTWNGYTFQAPTDSDQFIAQSIRMFGRIGVAWNRLALLLEFRTCLSFWRRDQAFWSEVTYLAQEHPLRPVAIGTASLLASKIFSDDIPPPLRKWADHKVDDRVRLWFERYGWDSLLTDFPGTTLLPMLQSPVAVNK